MTATLTLEFEDGSRNEIVLEHAVEIDISPNRNQSICFQQKKNGKYIMTFTKPLFDGKKIKTITMRKL